MTGELGTLGCTGVAAGLDWYRARGSVKAFSLSRIEYPWGVHGTPPYREAMGREYSDVHVQLPMLSLPWGESNHRGMTYSYRGGDPPYGGGYPG